MKKELVSRRVVFDVKRRRLQSDQIRRRGDITDPNSTRNGNDARVARRFELRLYPGERQILMREALKVVSFTRLSSSQMRLARRSVRNVHIDKVTGAFSTSRIGVRQPVFRQRCHLPAKRDTTDVERRERTMNKVAPSRARTAQCGTSRSGKPNRAVDPRGWASAVVTGRAAD